MQASEIAPLIRPHPAELRWLDVPWRSALGPARREAEAAGRPLFIWAMNGDPLGCV